MKSRKTKQNPMLRTVSVTKMEYKTLSIKAEKYN